MVQSYEKEEDLKYWNFYLLFLIVALGLWEIYKECRSGALVRKSLASYRSQGNYQGSQGEPFIRIKHKMKAWNILGVYLLFLVFMLGMAFNFVLPVLLTGDFSEMSGLPEMHKTPLTFVMVLLAIVCGTSEIGPFLLIKLLIFGFKKTGTLLFFDHHMEIRAVLYRKRQIYPYEALEVSVGKIGGNEFKSIAIRPSSPGRTTWMDHIGISNNNNLTTEEGFTRLEHFLEERVQNFHREEVIGGALDMDRKERKKKIMKRWVYVLILLSLLQSAFVVWYLLYCR